MPQLSGAGYTNLLSCGTDAAVLAVPTETQYLTISSCNSTDDVSSGKPQGT
jgi:hypothetical protein